MLLRQTKHIEYAQGNVLAVVSDKRNGDEPNVVSVSDYYLYDMQMPGRTYDADEQI